MAAIRRVLAVAFASAGPALAAPSATAYTVIDLTQQAGSTISASSVNAAGVVAGGFPGSLGPAYRYERGVFTPLPGLSERSSVGHSINDLGQIAGQSTRVFGGTGKARAVWWDAQNGLHPLGGDGDYLSAAYGIEDGGRIVGYTAEGGSAQAFLATTTSTATPLLPGSGREGRDVNAAGNVIGRLGSVSNWSVLGGTFAELGLAIGLHGLNDAGTIVGTAGSPARATRRSGGTDTALLPVEGYTSSGADAVNDRGVVVGRSLNTIDDSSATLWAADDFPRKLDLLVPPGTPHLDGAVDISDAGHVLAYHLDPSAIRSYFLLVPPRLTVGDVSVPEPASASANADFTVVLESPSTETVTVDYATQDGPTETGAEALELDYSTTQGTLTFPPGETSRTISVPVHADAATEGDETFLLKLANSSNAAIDTPQVTGTIRRGALEVKLQGAGVNPFDDTFGVRATITNVGSVPLENVHVAEDLAVSVLPYTLDSRGSATRIAGPDGPPAAPLAPGGTTTVQWVLQGDQVGYLFLTARFAGTAGGVQQAGASGLEVRIGESAPTSIGDLANVLLGGWYQLAGEAQEDKARLSRALGRYLSRTLKPFKRRSKVAPSAAERVLARSLDLPDDSFGFLPDTPGQFSDLVVAAVKGREAGKLRTLKKEVGGAVSTAVAAGGWIERTLSRESMAELGATGSELLRMGRDGELTGGWVAEAGRFYGYNLGDPAAAAETGRQLRQIQAEASVAARKAVDQAIVDGKKALADRVDTLQRNPVAAVQQISEEESAIETKAAVEIAKIYAGDRILKSVKLLRRVDKIADTADDVGDAYGAERAAGEVLDTIPAGPVSAEQMVARTGLTAAQATKMRGIVAQVEKRFGLTIEIKARPLSAGDAAKLKAGFIPKIEAIPIKKVNALDVQYLGANSKGLNEVGWFRPRRPSKEVLAALNPSKRKEVLERYALRQMEDAAMAGNDIADKVLQKKVTEMRKAMKAGGHTFEERIKGKVIRTTELELGVATKGNLNLLKNKGLKLNGRSVGRRGAGFTSDLDIEAALSGGKDLPAGVRGGIELSIQEALRADPELPFGFHGWRGFDLTASEANTLLVVSERLARLPVEQARKEAAIYAARLGVRPEDLLRVRRNGFLITFTREAVTLGP